MGWCIDSIIWYEVRDRILKGRYAGCIYDASTSYSPVVIRYRDSITKSEMNDITALFPASIRIEFQKVEYEGEQTTAYGNVSIGKGLEPICPQCNDKLLFWGTRRGGTGENCSIFRCIKCQAEMEIGYTFVANIPSK